MEILTRGCTRKETQSKQQANPGSPGKWRVCLTMRP